MTRRPSASHPARKVVPKVRCAIYTRKSSEEGLDMEFNSLDAQREACAAYVASQKAEPSREESTHYNEIACLRLQLTFLRRECYCAAKGQAFESSDQTVDEALSAMRRISLAQKEIRKQAIRNPAIRALIDKASKVRDCISADAVMVMNDVASQLERLSRQLESQ
jgi:hypothetical protein